MNVHIKPASVDDAFASLGMRAELLERYQSFMDQVFNGDVANPRHMELCRLRIAYIHGCLAEIDAESPAPLNSAEKQALSIGDFTTLSEEDRVVLAIAEQWPYNQHGVTDADVDALKAAVGDAASVALMTAIAFFDVRCRWAIAFSVTPTSDN
ncbi:MAG: hypothetical protein NXH85_17385 [Pseudomonadaceae bacterium]|nr:hypothetical protein [Pseudomonadaceae bacterium]